VANPYKDKGQLLGVEAGFYTQHMQFRLYNTEALVHQQIEPLS
jgi:hypothetical protein